MRLLLLLPATAALLLLAGCRARTDAVNCASGTRAYVSRDGSFAFCLPRGWEARERVRAYDVVARPAADWRGSGPVRYVAVDTSDARGAAVAAFAFWHIALWERNPRYQVQTVSAGEQFGGEEAYRVMVRGEEDGRAFSASVTYTVRGGVGYRWTNTIQAGHVGDLSDPHVSAMEASFRFLR